MSEDDRRGNLRLVGTILGVLAIVTFAFASGALLGWTPLSARASRAAGIVLAVTAATEGVVALFFLVRYRR